MEGRDFGNRVVGLWVQLNARNIGPYIFFKAVVNFGIVIIFSTSVMGMLAKHHLLVEWNNVLVLSKSRFHKNDKRQPSGGDSAEFSEALVAILYS